MKSQAMKKCLFTSLLLGLLGAFSNCAHHDNDLSHSSVYEGTRRIASITTGVAEVAAKPLKKVAKKQKRGKKKKPWVVSEIFLKGSIDGERLFLVYGLAESPKLIRKIMDRKLILDDLKDTGSKFYNKEHEADYKESFDRGVKWTKEHAKLVRETGKRSAKAFRQLTKASKAIYEGPWKSLKNIPGTMKVTLERGEEVYHKTDSKLSGSIKYGGYAAYAFIQGSYYLIIEAPARAVLGTGYTALKGVETGLRGARTTVAGLATVFSLPISITLHTARAGFSVAKTSVKLALKSGASLVVGGYSLLSSTVASAGALGVAAVLGTYRTGKWAVNKIPFSLNHASITRETNLDFMEQEDFANRVETFLSNLTILDEPLIVKSKIKKFRSTFKLYVKRHDSFLWQNKRLAFIINIDVHKKKIALYGRTRKSYVKHFKKHHEEFKEHSMEKLIEMVNKELEDMMNDIHEISKG